MGISMMKSALSFSEIIKHFGFLGDFGELGG